MQKHIKLITNTMLLIILLGVLMLPAASSGMMTLQKNHDVLSLEDYRPTQTPSKQPVKQTEVKVIKEKPYVRDIPITNVITPPTMESSATPTVEATQSPATE